MAPEYLLWGYLTYKADVYSFGVVALEIVAGMNNMKYRPDGNYVCLLDWALVLQRKGSLMELIDPSMLEGQVTVQELNMDPSIYDDELKFKALRDKYEVMEHQNSGETEILIPSSPPPKISTRLFLVLHTEERELCFDGP
ncbi:unnamed protein product [Ilex paraguariensis]|uniref:Protein kinase domain-containing protein n=1 Tax=Ilex paraguariensis TaxID=185542 RepID=A0ABC8SY52_9AQUA